MKRILFLVNIGEISSNANGGASVYYSHLELLYKAGFDVDVLALQWSNNNQFLEEDYKEIVGFVKSINTLKIESKKPKKNIKRLLNSVFRPEKFEYYFLNTRNKENLQKIITKNKIDLLWCEWRWAAILAGFSQLKTPIIYAHHDWEYKLARLRSKRTLIQKFHTFQKKRVEYKLVKIVNGSTSGSYTETREIEKISLKKSLYIPTTYDKITPTLKASKSPNIIHLGGMGTTANRLGLERFLDVCWKQILANNPNVKLIVVGGLKQASPELLKKLKGKNIVCKGFVKDLNTVLRPNDIHIIPWEYNTGTRTRIPVVLNYEQALVATKESVKAFPELIHNKNAILCADLEHMSKEINSLIQNSKEIEKLSSEGKKTFIEYFTVNNHVRRLNKYITELL